MGATVGADRPLITGLTGVRAIAAAWVVVGHFSEPLFALLPGSTFLAQYVHGGFLGVEVFFILSGFIIAYNYAERFSTFRGRTYRDFMLLRFARIYPVHLATLAAVAVLAAAAAFAGVALQGSADYGPVNYVANIFMLQSVPPFTAVNGPAWSICAEFGAYLAFPLLALWLVRVTTAARGFGWATLVLGIGMIAMLMTASFIEESRTGYAMIWLRITTEFTAGCLLYGAWRHLGSARTGRRWDIAAVVALAGIVGTIALTGGDNAVALMSLPFIALFILSCAGATGPFGRLLSTKLMEWGGRISYSVYMTHFILLMVVGKLVPWARFEDSNVMIRVAVLTAYAAAVVLAGWLCYRFVEEPARLLIRAAVAKLENRTVSRPVEAT